YIAIFVPWYWQEDYRAPVSGDFVLDAEERDYAALYALDRAQMAWRRRKIAELRDPLLFKQEYPANAAEAFKMSGHERFIAPQLLAKARKARCEPSGPLVIGFDPAWTGGDRHAMAWRQGRRVSKVECRTGLDTMQAAGWLKQVIDTDMPARVFIDVGGVGAGVYDRIREWGEPYSRIAVAVNFGAAPLEPPPLDERGQPCGGPLKPPARIWMESKEGAPRIPPVRRCPTATNCRPTPAARAIATTATRGSCSRRKRTCGGAGCRARTNGTQSPSPLPSR